MKTLLIVFVLLFALPSPIDGRRVHDFADIISTQTEAEIEKIASDTEKLTTAQIAVVTVSSLDGQDIDSYANELFNSWGIGQQDLNNGVLFLVAHHDRRTRIEVGYGLEPLISDSLAGEILDSEVVPRFREGDLEGGIINGTKELAAILQKYPEAARGIAGSAPSYLLTRSKKALYWALASIAAAAVFFILSFFFGKKRTYSSAVLVLSVLALSAMFFMAWQAYRAFSDGSRGLGPLVGAGFAGFLAFFQNIRRYRRYRPHHCEKCATLMNLMNETADDAKLSKEEQMEEKLGSVDYDIWLCPACQHTQSVNYAAIFSKYSRCPACKRRTYSETSKTIVAATYSSSGLAEVTGTCQLCNHSRKFNRVLPKLTRSSSSGGGRSGGGGFGGGSSGGGGASRGW